jgi:spermidine synthase
MSGAKKHWTKLGEAPIPGSSGRLTLFQGKDDFFIRTANGVELMSSRKHGSEDELGRLSCKALTNRENARVLVGGLGMGFTLAAVLEVVGAGAEVTVAELIPEVIEWNRGPLGERAGRPLDDPRTRVYEGDVADLLNTGNALFDAIALDVDNGPEALTQDDNDWLYSNAGLAGIRASLKPGGRVGFWSATPDPAFGRRLKQCGFRVEETRVYAHGKKGARHTLWFGW